MFDSYSQIFAKRAAEYHLAMKLAPRARDAEFRAVVDPLGDASAGVVYDMPSGGGYLADYLGAGLDYVAVDPATGFFVEWPKRRVRILAEITEVPLPDASADYIVSLAGLHHEASLPKVFKEMRRLLKPGGRLVMADVAVETPPARFLNGFVNQHCPLGHDGRFLDDRTAPALESSGFRLSDDQLLNLPWAFDGFDQAGEFCRHLFGVTSLDSAETVSALESEIGFDSEQGRPHLRWQLRRIVADAV